MVSKIFIAKIVANNCNDSPIQFTYKNQGANPRIKKQVCEMAMRGSGISAGGVPHTTNVLKMSAVTVILESRLWFKTHPEPSFEGTFENVIIDEM